MNPFDPAQATRTLRKLARSIYSNRRYLKEYVNNPENNYSPQLARMVSREIQRLQGLYDSLFDRRSEWLKNQRLLEADTEDDEPSW